MDGLSTIQHRIHELRGQRVMLDFDLAQLYGVETRVLNQSVKRNIERFPEDFMFQLTKGELELLRSQIATLDNLKSQIVTSNVDDIQEDENWKSQIVTSNVDDIQEDENWKSQIATSNFAKMGLRNRPYAFTEMGVAMLSSVLRSPQAIQVNIGIMRAFTAMRQMLAALPKPDVSTDVWQLRHDFEQLKLDVEDCLREQNDINEDTRAQLDAIATALAELQSKEPPQRPRRRIGFVRNEE